MEESSIFKKKEAKWDKKTKETKEKSRQKWNGKIKK